MVKGGYMTHTKIKSVFTSALDSFTLKEKEYLIKKGVLSNKEPPQIEVGEYVLRTLPRGIPIIFLNTADSGYAAQDWRVHSPQLFLNAQDHVQVALTPISDRRDIVAYLNEKSNHAEVVFTTFPKRGDGKKRAGIWSFTDDFRDLDRSYVRVKNRKKVLCTCLISLLVKRLSQNPIEGSAADLKIEHFSFQKNQWDEPTAKELQSFADILKNKYEEIFLSLKPRPKWTFFNKVKNYFLK